MAFLKRQLFFLVCGVVGVAGIALGVTGIARLSTIRTEMDQASRVYADLNSLRGGAANQKHIDVEQARIDKQMANYRLLLDKVRELQPYEPLLADFFPAPAADQDEREMRFEFRKRYQQAFADLMTALNAGRPATATQIQQAATDIELAQKQAAGLRQDPTAPAPAEEPYTPAGVLTKAGAHTRAQARANLENAQMIHCYAEPYDPEIQVPALEFHPQMRGKSRLDELTMKDCWEAQQALWIQQDVVAALVKTNADAAEAIKSSEQTPWVGNLPVKDIISLRVTRELVRAGTEITDLLPYGKPQGQTEARPVGTADASFNNRYSESGARFDVLQFTLKLVVDERDLMRVIQSISANRFHTLLRCSYLAQVPDPSMEGKIYGAEPVIKVVLDFETHLLADEYRRLMPDEVLEHYGFEVPASGQGKSKPKSDEQP